MKKDINCYFCSQKTKEYIVKPLNLPQKRDIGYNPNINPPMYLMEKYFNLYIEKVQPLIFEYSLQNRNGIHGIETHTNAVVFRGIDFAISLQQDPWPVILATGCHDTGRTNDLYDNDHALISARITMKLLKHFPELYNDKQMRERIISAVLNHTTGKTSEDYISICTWDADRVRMSWERGFREEFFTTPRAKIIAGSYYQKYIDYQKRCLSGYNWSKKY